VPSSGGYFNGLPKVRKSGRTLTYGTAFVKNKQLNASRGGASRSRWQRSAAFTPLQLEHPTASGNFGLKTAVETADYAEYAEQS